MEVIDLCQLALSLPDERKGLKQLIKDTIDIHSAHSDLKIANELAARFIALEKAEGFPRDVRDDLGLSLLVTGIVFYARATKTSSKHRKTFQIRSKLDANETADHDLMIRLRDDALAHFCPGKLGNDTVREDMLVFSIPHQKLFSTSRNICGSGSLAEVIRRQSQRAMLLMQRLYEDRQLKLLEALRPLPDCPDTNELLVAAMAQLKDIIGPEMAAQIEKGPFVGASRLSGGSKGA